MKKQQDRKDEALSGREQTRARILSAGLGLLQEGGRDAVTTRAVAERAGVQPPVLYRLFTDKEGLLNALTEHGFMLYLPQKGQKDSTSDPVEALRSGWDRHVQFGLDHPSLYLLMYTRCQVGPSPAAELSFGMLHQHIERVATGGRLRIPIDRAVALFHSAALGIVVTLLRSQAHARDLTLSSTARDNTLSMIAVTENTPPKRSALAAAASTIQAAVKVADGFSPGELVLFREWLERLTSF